MANQYIRRIQQGSNQSYFFYVPKDLLKELGIKKGDNVLIHIEEKAICIKKTRRVNT